MTSSDYMQTEVLRNVETGFCNIKTPDTGNPNARNPQFRNKPPTWKLEIRVDREDKQWQDFLAKVRMHASSLDPTDFTEGDEPWVLTKDERTITKEDGTNETYPSYEYIRVQTKKDPHAEGTVVGQDNKPFTDEVYNNSEVSVVVNTMYNPVSNHIITFYLSGLKVHRNGTGGGGGGKAQAMALLGVPDFGDAEDAPAGGKKWDPSDL
jgi:hypothetical protein